jgi:hypothetical protein
LLGRTERLDDWAQQFYAARSRVAHEGRVGDRYYYGPQRSKQKQVSALFGSLVLYGRQIFQLCLDTLLVGADLAERADLREKLVTNNERFEKICQSLDLERWPPEQRLVLIEPIVRSLERYQFIPSGELSKSTMVGAVRRAVQVLLTIQPLSANISDALTTVAKTKREDGELDQLASIESLWKALQGYKPANIMPAERVVYDLVNVTWMRLFQHYYSLKQLES